MKFCLASLRCEALKRGRNSERGRFRKYKKIEQDKDPGCQKLDNTCKKVNFHIFLIVLTGIPTNTTIVKDDFGYILHFTGMRYYGTNP